ncbi:hypothetical protein F4678DRAFT_460383 [Xylaria arbuscula]|nr:hypothetical protein F4678DRAFT_460383 [Xylaria arbuscula]
MPGLLKTVAVLAIAFLGLVDAGIVVKAPRTEPLGLSSGHVFVQPVPTLVPTTTTILSAVSTTSSIANTSIIANTSRETPCSLYTGMTHARNPDITAAPTLDLDLDSQGQKFVQTTYWACATLGGEAHCGWHEPILDTSAANMRVGGENIAIRAGGVAALMIGALALVL